jgi:hypothetical protein
LLVGQSPLDLLSRKDFVAFAIEDAHSNRLRRPLYIRGGDDCGRRIRHFNLLLSQVRRAPIDRPANKLDPKRPRLLRDDSRRFVG